MEWYYYTYYVLIVIAITLAITRFKNLSKSGKILLPLLVTTFIAELVAIWAGHVFNTNWLVYSIFQPIQYALIAIMYYLDLQKKIILISIVIYAILAIFNILIWQRDLFGSNMLLLNILLTSIWILFYLKQLLQFPTNHAFHDFSLFWVSFGFLIFNMSCLFIYGAYNFLMAKELIPIASLLLLVRVVVNHLLYVLIGLSIVGKQKDFKI